MMFDPALNTGEEINLTGRMGLESFRLDSLESHHVLMIQTRNSVYIVKSSESDMQGFIVGTNSTALNQGETGMQPYFLAECENEVRVDSKWLLHPMCATSRVTSIDLHMDSEKIQEVAETAESSRLN
ncbi:hypothetical protein HY312_01775 [Candidatus Saccharibacteria bacterium]|nr:hypothetical protein [Candidatus Saccharibacteria bacterium]